MIHRIKIITTEDPQLDGLNVVLELDTKEKAFELLSLIAENGYKVQYETD